MWQTSWVLLAHVSYMKHAHMHHSHPGFHAAAEGIAHRQGIPMARASAILASSTRHASPAAKKANPALKNVRMGKMDHTHTASHKHADGYGYHY